MVAPTATKYLTDTNNLTGYAQVVEELTEVNGLTVVTNQFTYGNDLISQRQLINGNRVTSFFLYDGHGSVRALTDSNGVITDQYDYDAFGNLINVVGNTPNNYLYAGEQFDHDLNLYYNRARYLSVEKGRFWSQDFDEGFNENTLSLHKYTYTSNNPVNGIDPSGLFTIKEAIIIAGYVSALFNLGAVFYHANNARVAKTDEERIKEYSYAVSSLISVFLSVSGGSFLGPTLSSTYGVSVLANPTAQVLQLGLITATTIQPVILMAANSSSGNGNTSSPTPPTTPANSGSVNIGAPDSLGRPTGIVADLTDTFINTNGPKGTAANPNRNPPGYPTSGNSSGNSLYVRAHLFGKQFGGSGDDPNNLVTFFRSANRFMGSLIFAVKMPIILELLFPKSSMSCVSPREISESRFMLKYENDVKRAVLAGERITYRVTPIYNGNNLVPVAIEMQATGNRGFNLSTSIRNVQ